MTKTINEGGFISHLTELRKRLINSFIFLFIFFVLCYFFAEYIYGFLVEPYSNAVKNDGIERRLIFTALQETFLTYLKVSFFAAFFITCPFILMQIWKFIAPGLYKHEKIAILPYLVLTPILFFLGGMLVYYLIMPLAIKFFLSFESTGINTNLPIQLEAKVNEYLSLVMKLIFAFGLSFQLPVVLSLLARVGIIDSKADQILSLSAAPAGLVVGIVGYICYNHLVVKISKVVYQMQASSLEFLDLLNEPVS